VDQIKVLLADDHAIVRAGIRALIDRIEGVEVVAEASETSETLRQIEVRRPRIVLIDVSLPGANNLEILTLITDAFPEVGVIILALQENVEFVREAMRLGAKSCLTATASQTELELAIKTVAAGEKYLPADLAQTFQALVDEPGKQDALIDLTVRQTEVLRMIAKGQSTKGIALALNISVKTVESHRGQLMMRLNIHDIAGLVRYAVKHGLVDID
jgi:DNA-binding NarL/FixJ family response regulator